MARTRILGVLLLTMTLLLAGCTGTDADAEPDTEEPDELGGLQNYNFEGSDSSANVTTSTDDDLLNIIMTQGNPTNWSEIEIKISVDNAAPFTCKDSDSSGECVYESNGNQNWAVGEEITIAETSTDLCSSTCNISATIYLIGADSNHVLDSFDVQVN